MLKIIKRYKYFFLSLAGIYLAVSYFIFINFENSSELYLDQKLERSEYTLKSVLDNYRSISELLFKTLIETDEILYIVENAWDSETKAIRDFYRKRLLEKVGQVYQEMKNKGFRQVHFHFPDSTSFLRMHRPEKYGDDLSDVRTSVNLANVKKEVIEGFEEGRIFNGYRFVFPLNYNGRHIGTVENSISFIPLSDQLASLAEIQMEFLMSREIVTEKVFKSEQDNYTASELSDDYVIDKVFLDRDPVISNEILNKIRNDISVLTSRKMRSRESFPLFCKINGTGYIVSLMAIENIQGQHAGYLALYEQDSYLLFLRKLFISRSLYAFLLFCVIILFAYYNARFTGKLESMASTDPLTKVFNRRKFDEIAEYAMNIRKRYNTDLSFLMFDVDEFKTLNDNFGHALGDLVLQTITETCMKTLRKTDTIARWGGDEFMIMMPETDHCHASVIAERIRQKTFNRFHGRDFDVTLSIGITVSREEDKNLDDIYARADKALYKAKANGKNRTEKLL